MATFNGDGDNNRIAGEEENDFINGFAGNDRLFGAVGDDKLYGGIGADTLLGEIGFDYLDGGDGDDFLDGGVGDDGQVIMTHSAELGIIRWGFNVNNVVGGLLGYAENDRIFGGDGNDVGLGGLGDDLMFGESGNDVLFGGSGTDTIRGGVGNDVVVGDTHVNVNFADPTITGGSGARDILFGEGGDDLMIGGTGSDEMYGGDGIDYLFGSMTNASTTPEGFLDLRDQLFGGKGDDVLRGGTGDDELAGGDDEDNLRGDFGNDVLDGGRGVDLVSYRFDDVGLTQGARFAATGIGPDGASVQIADGLGWTDTVVNVERVQVVGSALDDALTGGQGDDLLFGNNGADVLAGQKGEDQIDGGGGDDTLIGDEGDDRLIGGAGLDTAFFDFEFIGGVGQSIRINFDASGYTGTGTGSVVVRQYGTDSLEGIERLMVRLNPADDLFIGSGVSDHVFGYGGLDRLEGRGGDDVLTGGYDFPDFRAYEDSEGERLVGGTGNDTYFVDDDSHVIERLDEGHDTVRSVALKYTLPLNVEDLVLLPYVPRDGRDGNGIGYGNALANRITGNERNNVLEGRAGDDLLFGENGDDILKSGTGIDLMRGGAGDDTYFLESRTAQAFELAGEGIDTIKVGYTYTLDDEFENLVLTGTADINASGNDVDNYLTGNAGRNVLSGGGGDDVLEGAGGSDLLRLGAGTDTIVIGTAGDSTGLNHDTVTGGFFDLEDLFDLGVVPTSIAIFNGGILRVARFDLDLALAVDETVLAAGGAALFNPASGDFEGGNPRFLIVDANGQAGYQAGQDYVIALIGFTGTITSADFI